MVCEARRRPYIGCRAWVVSDIRPVSSLASLRACCEGESDAALGAQTRSDGHFAPANGSYASLMACGCVPREHERVCRGLEGETVAAKVSGWWRKVSRRGQQSEFARPVMAIGGDRREADKEKGGWEWESG